jgi:uncharacterized repeat protein (TIGR03803 family)
MTKTGLALGAIFATAAFWAPQAQAVTYTVLHTFAGAPTDGANSASSLISDAGGNLYGTTYAGGATNQGAVFEWASAGPETLLYSFTGGADGGGPEAGLVFGSTGNLYGTTYFGGAYGYGVVFELSPGSPWTEKVLYNFTGATDGAYPQSTLISDSSGNLYGTTVSGGSGAGVVFVLLPGSPNWTEVVLYAFSGAGDGGNPAAGLVRDAAGNLFGTTEYGGASGDGVVFKLDTSLHETTLYSFTGGADGANPQATLALDAAGNLYGTTPYGGLGYGVVFKVNPSGNEIVLHTFTGGADGAYPYSGVILGTANRLYGVTYFGGAFGDGTAFKMTTGGVETVLHSFKSGQYPFAGLFQNASGTYGTTYYGGSGSGVLFDLH